MKLLCPQASRARWRRMRNIFFASLILLPMGYVTGIAGLNYSGFCFDEGHYLSDQEIIQRVVDSQITSTNAEEFIKKNTDCCEVVNQSPVTLIAYGDQYSPSLENRLLGIRKKLVHLKFISKIQTGDGQIEESLQNRYISTTNCGVYNRLDSR